MSEYGKLQVFDTILKPRAFVSILCYFHQSIKFALLGCGSQAVQLKVREDAQLKGREEHYLIMSVTCKKELLTTLIKKDDPLGFYHHMYQKQESGSYPMRSNLS